jgi:hypothetical protein
MPISAQPAATAATATRARRRSAGVHRVSASSTKSTANGTRKKPMFSIAFETSSE